MQHGELRKFLYSASRSDLKMTTGLLYVVSVHFLAKLWDNEFSWNHDRTYLLQVMVGFVLCVIQDHNQGPYSTWDICQKRVLNSNHAKSRLPKYSSFNICSIVLKCCTLHSVYWYWHGVCKISKTCVNWKGFYWLTRFCEIWDWDEFRTYIRLHWSAPLEPDFFSSIVLRVPNLVWLRFVLVECFSYHYCSRIWSPAQFFRYIDGQYYLYQYCLY